jgi:Predicted RNA-binding protein (contains KH domain)
VFFDSTGLEAGMKELVEVIAGALVDDPASVVVTETEDDNQIVLSLTVASDDMGKVIGKQGRIAKAIRTVVRAAGSKSDKKIMVDIQ